MNDDALPLNLTNLPDIIPRLAGESAPAYEAVCLYAQLGPERSTARVAQKLCKSKALIDRWSGRHHWVRRVQQFDALVAAAAQASYLAAATALAKANAEEASAMRARALARLQAVPLDDISPAVALKIWEACVRIGRLSLGMPTDATQANVQQQVNANVSVDTQPDETVALLVHNPRARELATRLFDELMCGDDDGDGDMDGDADGDDRDNDTTVTLTDDELDDESEAE